MPQFNDPKYYVRDSPQMDEIKPSGYAERMRRQAVAGRQVSGKSPEEAYGSYVTGAAAQTARSNADRANRRYGSKPVQPST